ncbi:MAG: TRAP transporter small permease subunit [Desulfarculus sp.]|nr:TRAP transporter small permease subunit [Pseudomonadota bacterium]MBV1717290.1 TRAP transporter small permease subunit [Desulfarculus sp.]MBU4576337.1 TRAP transporter small permease subunit [Pseudomonadota bacterium]MBU4596877.1 TRAP transporter small permease subunit [Pseudomonadota bacterium]MBV1739526.1 TRAP transporter small permease subunit [Desulfarculus sp.]
MNALRRFANGIDKINEYVGRFVSWITALLVLVVFADVVMRYVFQISFVFTQELEWHLFGFIFLIGAGYTLLHDGHVRVDIIYQKLGSKAQAWINFIGCLFFLFPGCFLVVFTSLGFVENSFAIFEGSPDPGGVPLRFILKSMIPLGFILVWLQGLSLFIKSFLVIIGREESRQEAA